MGSHSSRPSADGVTLDSLTDGLEQGRFKQVVVLCGAGISTAAGVPDFRSPSAGLYFRLRKYNLPYPEAIFEAGYFRRNPAPFFALVRELFPETLTPTTTHKFFQLLNERGVLRRVYTQNIDALEGLAGLPEDKLVEAHGSFRTGRCVKCGRQYDLAWMKRQIFAPESDEGVPKCQHCPDGKAGVVRPDVVLFGEALPDRFWRLSADDLSACDLLLVFGTSLAVAPFNTLVARPKAGVPRVYVNLTRPGAPGGFLGWMLGLMSGGRRGVKFDGANDLIVLADCDETVRRLCDKIPGWREQLEELPVQVLEP